MERVKIGRELKYREGEMIGKEIREGIEVGAVTKERVLMRVCRKTDWLIDS